MLESLIVAVSGHLHRFSVLLSLWASSSKKTILSFSLLLVFSLRINTESKELLLYEQILSCKRRSLLY